MTEPHAKSETHAQPCLGPIPGSMLASLVGAIVGTIAVVLAASWTWQVVIWDIWMLLGPGIGGTLGVGSGRRWSGTTAATIGGVSGTLGGGAGSFFAVASRETYPEANWAIFGGLCGVALGAVVATSMAFIMGLGWKAVCRLREPQRLRGSPTFQPGPTKKMEQKQCARPM